MSLEPALAPTGTATDWPVLSAHERRVLGVLVEKAKTTPDVYPLSMNSLVTGCNQKSNRDPILNLSDVDAEEALLALQKRVLVARITGGRVERWRHCLYEAWKVNKVELAILAELLLRGPQTEGELRARASRMEPIADLDALRAALGPLTERRLTVYLTPEGRRGTVLTHGFHSPKELEHLRTRHHSAADLPEDTEPAPTNSSADSPRRDRSGAPESMHGLEEARAEIGQLRDVVDDLQNRVATLAEQVRQLQESLGINQQA